MDDLYNEVKKNDYKEKLEEHINERIEFLRDKLQLISLKYDNTRKLFNNCSLIILIISALLTLIDAFKLLISQYIEDNNESAKNMIFITNIVSLTFGTLMTVLTSIIRFKNYRENMEKLKETQEKLIQLKAEYAKEEGILILMEEPDLTTMGIIEEKLEEYNEKLNRINIMGFISNKQMLRFQKYISKFKVSLQEIKKDEREKINKIIS
tara:strand:+ start:12003 stop:12629 length:627 start_codon:yes stop_codon:yes gene_type:complete